MSSILIVKTNRYNFNQNQVRFSFVLAHILKTYLETGKLEYKSSYYRVLTYLRRKLKIPGKSYQKLPHDLKNKYPLIASWAFHKKKKEEKIEMYDEYIKNAKLPE